MKYVRLQNNIVREIIPDYASPPEKWYGAEFAAQCAEAPDNVTQGMAYDPVAKTFSTASTSATPQSDPMADLAETVSDLMVEVDKIKLGVTD